jgi:hypothetical protein
VDRPDRNDRYRYQKDTGRADIATKEKKSTPQELHRTKDQSQQKWKGESDLSEKGASLSQLYE